VKVKRVNLGLLNQAILSDIIIESPNGDTIISIDKLSGDFELLPLLNEDLYINSIQVYGMKANLYRFDPNSPLNIQFIIDNISARPQKEKKNVVDVSQIIVRNSSLKYDILSLPHLSNGKLDFNHINLSGINADLIINNLSSSLIDIELLSMRVKETNSDLIISNFDSNIRIHSGLINILHPSLSINNSSIESNNVLIDTNAINNTIGISGDVIKSVIYLHDFKAIIPSLNHMQFPISVNCIFAYNSNNISFENVYMSFPNNMFRFIGDIHAYNINTKSLSIRSKISDLLISATSLEYLKPVFNINNSFFQTIKKVDVIRCNGQFDYSSKIIKSNVYIESPIGSIKVDGNLTDFNHLISNVSCENIYLSKILPQIPINNTSFDMFVDLYMKSSNHIEGMLKGDIAHIEYDNLNYDNIKIDGKISPQQYSGFLSIHDKKIDGIFKGVLDGLSTGKYMLKAHLELNNFSPSIFKFRINNNISDHTYNLNGDFDISGTNFSNLNGNINIRNISINGPKYNYELNNLMIDLIQTEDNYKSINWENNIISGNIQGYFSYNNFYNNILKSLNVITPFFGLNELDTNDYSDVFTLNVAFKDSPLLHDLLIIPFDFQDSLLISTNVDNRKHTASYSLISKSISYSDYKADNLIFNYNKNNNRYIIDGKCKLYNTTREIDLDLNADGDGSIINSHIIWSLDKEQNVKGVLNLTGTLNFTNNQIAHVTLSPSEIKVLDQQLKIEANYIDIFKNRIEINELKAFNEDRSVIINGILSDNPSDSIMVDINGTTIDNVLELTNTKAPNITGYVYGNCYIYNVLHSPRVNANLYVDDLSYKNSDLGHAILLANWDNNHDGIIVKSTIMKSDNQNSITSIDGYIYSEDSRLDLKVTCENTDASFLNSMLFRPFKNIYGSINGNVYITGPFNNINIYGTATTDAKLTLRATNVTYSVCPEDPILITTNSFVFENIHISDKNKTSNIINGVVSHEKFKNFKYDFDMNLDNILLYEENNFNSDKFKGIIYGDGTFRLNGSDGHPLIINAEIYPTKGSEFSYDASTPDAITTNSFITFREITPSDSILLLSGIDPQEYWFNKNYTDEPNSLIIKDSYRGDIYMNLNIHMNHNCPVKLKMDNVEDGFITTYGTGVLHADYHNKGGFSLNGTYKIQEGKYRLYLQDIIFRDLILQNGSNVIFNGNPFDADIHLICWHTLQSVPLSDLTNAVYTQNNRVKVICILDITGHLGNMNFKFDLNLPNVSDETRQIVKSYISTEEEMNRQLIYLLGFGRFYTNEYARSNGETNTTQAVNSLISSTLSGQINQMLSNAVGTNSKWNFGTGISTGEHGWEDVDVEGTLSGKLLDDRLLINGNIGYRDNSMTNNSSFIGDFDVRWRLSSTGNTYLKAYNLTNDRYFTKSTLNTQGVGATYQRDFESWRDLFRRKKRGIKNEIIVDHDSIVIQNASDSIDFIIFTQDSVSK